jgi:hypothetical protein
MAFDNLANWSLMLEELCKRGSVGDLWQLHVTLPLSEGTIR